MHATAALSRLPRSPARTQVMQRPGEQVTGDKKTPAEAKDFCASSAKEFGIECIYQTPEDQVEWLKSYPELGEEIPWNCIQRRNLAILVAFEKGCDVIITIDDDNYFVEGQDFVGEHSQPILKTNEHSALKSNTGWLNVCEFLEDKRKVEFYPRGYPMNQRWKEPKAFCRTEKQKRKVVVNAGLWLDDPDVDAITRLTNDISAVRYTKDESFTMQKGTWCPFNSQNTAMAREMIPAYCLSPNIGRYDDIWAGSRPAPCSPLRIHAAFWAQVAVQRALVDEAGVERRGSGRGVGACLTGQVCYAAGGCGVRDAAAGMPS